MNFGRVVEVAVVVVVVVMVGCLVLCRGWLMALKVTVMTIFARPLLELVVDERMG